MRVAEPTIDSCGRSPDLLLLHGTVIARFGEAQILIGYPGHRNVELAGGAVRPVQV